MTGTTATDGLDIASAVRRQQPAVLGSSDAKLLFNIDGLSSLRCTLLHAEDASPLPGFYFATDGGNSSLVAAAWGEFDDRYVPGGASGRRDTRDREQHELSHRLLLKQFATGLWVSVHQRAGRIGGNMKISQLAARLAVVLGLSATGCLDDGNQDATVACTEQGSLIWSNGLNWSNGLSWSNGVQWSNGVAWSNGAIWSNGIIWSNGLASVDDVDFSCHADSLQLFEYTVGCALGADQHVDVRIGDQVKTIAGRLGLAPEWADGPCDGECRGWVSACLIASLNGKGERVELAVSGNHPALGTDPVPGFTVPEATFYGDVFADRPQLHACLAPGVTELERSCAGRSDCPIAVAGVCADVCDARGCRADGQLYEQVISTSLRPDPIYVSDAVGAAELRTRR